MEKQFKENKICRKCSVSLTKDNQYKTYWYTGYSICVICLRKYRKKYKLTDAYKTYIKSPKVYERRKRWAEKNKEWLNDYQKLNNRSWRLQKVYGITEEDYKQILQKQNGCCAICKSNVSNTKLTDYMVIDHDHKNNKIRGLLCAICNQALGLFKDNIKNLQEAIKYLEEHK
jgi:hypothetical protein